MENNELFNSMKTFVYLIYTKEKGIYKIGRSQKNPIGRIIHKDNYPIIMNTYDSIELEAKLKEVFNKNFKLVEGYETFSGDKNLMDKLFTETVVNFNNEKELINNNYQIENKNNLDDLKLKVSNSTLKLNEIDNKINKLDELVKEIHEIKLELKEEIKIIIKENEEINSEIISYEERQNKLIFNNLENDSESSHSGKSNRKTYKSVTISRKNKELAEEYLEKYAKKDINIKRGITDRLITYIDGNGKKYKESTFDNLIESLFNNGRTIKSFMDQLEDFEKEFRNGFRPYLKTRNVTIIKDED